jgi:hypothetical protein
MHTFKAIILLRARASDGDARTPIQNDAEGVFPDLKAPFVGTFSDEAHLSVFEERKAVAESFSLARFGDQLPIDKGFEIHENHR